MLKPRVYLAGPIAGTSWDEATGWRDWVAAELEKRGLAAVSPMRMKEWYKEHDAALTDYSWLAEKNNREYLLSGEPHAIGMRDFNDVATSQGVLAYLPKEINDRRPSWGTSIELGWATAQRKLVVLVTDDPSLESHPLVRTHVGFIVDDLGLGVDAMAAALGVFSDAS